jgi:Planctomycete cytochrome C
MNINSRERTILLSLLFVFGCRHEPVIPVSPIFTFNNDVSSITLNNCATVGCHDGSSERRRLQTYSEVMHYVTPGKPYSSKLFTDIIKLSGNKMPPNGPLSDPQIRTIYVWILQGAKEN